MILRIRNFRRGVQFFSQNDCDAQPMNLFAKADRNWRPWLLYWAIFGLFNSEIHYILKSFTWGSGGEGLRYTTKITLGVFKYAVSNINPPFSIMYAM